VWDGPGNRVYRGGVTHSSRLNECVQMTRVGTSGRPQPTAQGSNGRGELRVPRNHVWSDGLERADGTISYRNQPLSRWQQVLVDGT
jgi:hypothetical protein